LGDYTINKIKEWNRE